MYPLKLRSLLPVKNGLLLKLAWLSVTEDLLLGKNGNYNYEKELHSLIVFRWEGILKYFDQRLLR